MVQCIFLFTPVAAAIEKSFDSFREGSTAPNVANKQE